MRQPVAHIIAWIAILILPFSCMGQPGKANWNGNRFGQNLGLRYAGINDIFSSDYLRDSTYAYYIHPSDTVWKLGDKYYFKYDVQGRQIESLHAIEVDSLWENVGRLRNYYSDHQALTVQEEDIRDSASGAWAHWQRRIYSYNPYGLLARAMTLEWMNNRWNLYDKVEYSYTIYHRLSSQIFYTIKKDRVTWLKSQRYLFTYTPTNNIAKQIFQVWDDSTQYWVNDFSREFEYNSENDLISTIRRDWNPEKTVWVQKSVVSLYYNEAGQVFSTRQNQFSQASGDTLPFQVQSSNYDQNGNIGLTTNSLWNSNEKQWEPYKKLHHFWTKYLNGNLDVAVDDIDCVFANPYKAGLPWYCQSLKPNVKYTVQVFDQLGRCFYSDQFMGDSSFQISKPLPDGFYIVVIRGGVDYHTEKVLIRN